MCTAQIFESFQILKNILKTKMLPQTITSLFPDVKETGAIEGRHHLGNQQENTPHTELSKSLHQKGQCLPSTVEIQLLLGRIPAWHNQGPKLHCQHQKTKQKSLFPNIRQLQRPRRWHRKMNPRPGVSIGEDRGRQQRAQRGNGCWPRIF